MKLLSVSLARSIWICNAFELNPQGKSLYPVLSMLLNTYKFRKFPSQNDNPDATKGFIFENGDYKNNDGDIISITLTLFPDGLIAETRSSTDDTDAFLVELLTNIDKTLKLPGFQQAIRSKKYVSQLYVTTEKSLNSVNPKLMKITKYLSDYFLQPYEIGSIAFWPDQTTKAVIPNFSFERVIGLPFSENRYFTSSGLQTNQHLDLLDKLEKLL